MRTKIILACLGVLALSLYVANAATPFTISSKVFDSSSTAGATGSAEAGLAGPGGSWGWNNPWGGGGGKDDGKGDKGPGGPGGPGHGGPVMDLPPMGGFPGLGGGGGPIGYQGPLSPQEMQLYQSVAHADLSGWQVVPPVCTDARGTFDIWTPWEEDRLPYELTTYGSETLPSEVTLNIGFPGEDGQVLAYLCTADQAKQKRHNCGACKVVVDRDSNWNGVESRNRVYIKGSLRSQDLEDIAGCDADDRLECVIRAMQYQGLAGGLSPVYVQVGTAQFPHGEIRGQLKSRSWQHFSKGHGKDGKSKQQIWKDEGYRS